MIECEITKISPPSPPTPKSIANVTTEITTDTIKTISKVSIFNPASWPYRVKIATLISIAILLIALFLRVRYIRKTNNTPI